MKLREKLQPYAWPAYLVLLLGVGVSTIAVEAAMPAHSHSSAAAPGAAAKCEHTGETITVEVGRTGLSPANINAKRCDVLVFHNSTAAGIEIAFGQHQRHVPYPGLANSPIKPGGKSSLVLAQAGNFPVHDHSDEQLQGKLAVSN